MRRPLPSCILMLALGAAPAAAGGADSPDREGGDVEPGRSGEPPAVTWALAIHGGAGAISRDMPVETRKGYLEALTAALRLGHEHLAAGGSALDAVEKVVVLLEEDERFNAGKGAVYTHEGGHELDAAIMDGATLAAGAVAAVQTVRNPIRLARLVMEKTEYVFLTGDGAEAMATELGVERVDSSWFDTERRFEQLQEQLEQGNMMETVGAVARDRQGHLAAATSTGGRTNKRFGRIGDVPVIGAGTYADDRSCAVSGTGKGEQFIRHTVARSIAALVEHGGLPLQEAAERVIHGRLEADDGGVIAVDGAGRIATVFNSEGMFRGAADSTGRFEVHIWE